METSPMLATSLPIPLKFFQECLLLHFLFFVYYEDTSCAGGVHTKTSTALDRGTRLFCSFFAPE